MEKNIKIKKRHLKREVKGFLAAMFLVWLVLGGIMLNKVLAPSVKMYFLQDNHVYAQRYVNPSNWEAKDEAYLSYNEYANTLINNEDDIISWFFNLNKIVKLLIIAVSIAPFCISIVYVYNVIENFFTKQIERIKGQKHIAVRG